MKNKCTITGTDNVVIQGNGQSSEIDAERAEVTWSSPAVTILCIFSFLLGCAAYKFLLWRWF